MTRKLKPGAYARWGGWQYFVLNGRVRKRIEFPRREQVLVRTALKRIHLRYKEIIAFFNPYWHGWKGSKPEGTIQWLDFCVLMTNKRLGVIIFYPKYGRDGEKPWDLRALEAKKKFLEEQHIPYLIIRRNHTSQMYEVMIRNWMKRETTK